METTFNKKSNITIHGWMRTDIGLSGNELICYAIVYGFSHSEESKFCGSLSYMSHALGVTRQNAMKILVRLVDKGLIRKEEYSVNGVKYCNYSTVEDIPF